MLVWSPLEALPRGFLGPGATIVDVGAHVGEWAEAILRFLVAPQLVAIEPGPEAFARLTARLEAAPGVSLYRCAVGSAQGEGVLNLMASSDLNSLLSPSSDLCRRYPGGNVQGSVIVPVMPLDILLAAYERVDLLKIDVQGSEASALSGAGAVLSRTRAVQLEVNFQSHYSGDSLFWDLHQILTDAGFHLHNLVNLYQGSELPLQWGDAIYMRDEAGGP